MKRLRSIALFILITAVVLTSMYLLLSRYMHDRIIAQMPAQQSSISEPADAVADGGKQGDNADKEEEGSKKPEEKKAYSFELEDISGKKLKLADYKGKRIVISFFTTWSPYCIDGLPGIQNAYGRLKDEKDAVLFAIDVSEDSKTVQKFAEDNELTLPVLLDKDGEIAGIYGIQSFPATIFINSDGTVYEDIHRSVDEETILAVIDKMK